MSCLCRHHDYIQLMDFASLHRGRHPSMLVHWCADLFATTHVMRQKFDPGHFERSFECFWSSDS